MATVTIPGLQQLVGEIDPAEDFVVIHHSSLPEGSRSVRAPVQKILDLIASGNLTVNRQTLTGDVQFLIDDSPLGRNVQSLDPGGQHRQVTIPFSTPEAGTRLFIHNRDLDYRIRLIDNDNTTVLGTLGGGFSYSWAYCYFDGVEWLIYFTSNPLQQIAAAPPQQPPI